MGRPRCFIGGALFAAEEEEAGRAQGPGGSSCERRGNACEQEKGPPRTERPLIQEVSGVQLPIGPPLPPRVLVPASFLPFFNAFFAMSNPPNGFYWPRWGRSANSICPANRKAVYPQFRTGNRTLSRQGRIRVEAGSPPRGEKRSSGGIFPPAKGLEGRSRGSAEWREGLRRTGRRHRTCAGGRPGERNPNWGVERGVAGIEVFEGHGGPGRKK